MTSRLLSFIHENGIEAFIVKEVISSIKSLDEHYAYIAVEYGEPYDRLSDDDLAQMEEILLNEPDVTSMAEDIEHAAQLVYRKWANS